AAGLPDALLGLVPVLGQPVQHPADRRPPLVGERQAALHAGVDAVHRLAVDVELQLLGGAVADPDGCRAAVAAPVVEPALFEAGGAVDPVHDVERSAVAADPLADAVAEPAAEL